MSATQKTDNRYLGPYEVVRKNKGGAYLLKELDRTNLTHITVAAFRLLPYITWHHWFMETGWMAEEDDEEDSYELEIGTSSSDSDE